jgi:hypothetical protein
MTCSAVRKPKASLKMALILGRQFHTRLWVGKCARIMLAAEGALTRAKELLLRLAVGTKLHLNSTAMTAAFVQVHCSLLHRLMSWPVSRSVRHRPIDGDANHDKCDTGNVAHRWHLRQDDRASDRGGRRQER